MPSYNEHVDKCQIIHNEGDGRSEMTETTIDRENHANVAGLLSCICVCVCVYLYVSEFQKWRLNISLSLYSVTSRTATSVQQLIPVTDTRRNFLFCIFI